MSISTMLVPVGLEARDEKVLRYVCGLQVQSVRRVIVATAVDATGMEAPVVAAEVDRARERLAAMTSAAHDCALDLEIRVVTGDPTSAMLALAHQAGVDVICCGTEGKSVVDYLFSGSVSENLFTSGKVRTMTVRYDQLDAVDDPGELARNFAKRLVVPIDFSASSSRAFLSALERPHEALGEVHAVHVLPEGASDEERNEVDIKLRGLLEIASDYDAVARGVILTGKPGDALMDYLNEIEATGCITGQRGRGRLQRVVLGSVSMRLLREAPCPVVVQP